MGFFAVLGIIFSLVVGFFLPRMMVCLFAGFILGGGFWWILFIPLAIIAFVVDWYVMDKGLF